jgi:hypothetical protein
MMNAATTSDANILSPAFSLASQPEWPATTFPGELSRGTLATRVGGGAPSAGKENYALVVGSPHLALISKQSSDWLHSTLRLRVNLKWRLGSGEHGQWRLAPGHRQPDSAKYAPTATTLREPSSLRQQLQTAVQTWHLWDSPGALGVRCCGVFGCAGGFRGGRRSGAIAA